MERILIVDDDVDFAEGLADLLASHGYDCTMANSGDEAVEKIRSEHFDMTLMDVRMPNMNGVETLREFRSLRPGINVVMMTGFSIDELLEEARRLGAREILSKPLDIGKILERLADTRHGNVILLVDDDRDFAEGMRDVLLGSGYAVEVLTSGSAAIDRIVNNGIVTLILDLRMPDMHGYDVVKRLDELGVSIPTIVVTANDIGDEAGRLQQASPAVRGILQKPFPPEHLLELIPARRPGG